MASNIQIDDQVYVCPNRLPTLPDQGNAFFKGNVVGKQERSVRIGMPDGTHSDLIATRFVHHRVGVAVFQIGDIVSEATLLDPLSKTVLQYCRLLFGDDVYVRQFKVRSAAELNELYRTQSFHPYEHIIFIGHGSEKGYLRSAIDQILSTDNLITIFSQNNPSPWHFLFLCCYLGRAAFAKQFLQENCCKSMVAPSTASMDLYPLNLFKPI